jgi:hypothetical protein
MLAMNRYFALPGIALLLLDMLPQV